MITVRGFSIKHMFGVLKRNLSIALSKHMLLYTFIKKEYEKILFSESSVFQFCSISLNSQVVSVCSIILPDVMGVKALISTDSVPSTCAFVVLISHNDWVSNKRQPKTD